MALHNRNIKIFLVVLVAIAAGYFLYHSHLYDRWRPQLFSSDLESPTEEDNKRTLKLATFEDRRNHIREECQARQQHYLNVTSGMAASLFLTDKKHNLVMCYIFKNACSFWIRIFAIITGKIRNKSIFDLYDWNVHKSPLPYSTFDKKPFIETYRLLHTSRTFMFVRDPFDRLFSAYVDKFLSPCAPVAQREEPVIFKHIRRSGKMAGCQPGVNFTETVQYVTTLPFVKLDLHFEKQHKLCYPCHVDYQYIGKIETFRQDYKFILRELVHVDPRSLIGPEETFQRSNALNIMEDVTRRSFTRCPSYKRLSKYGMLQRLWVTFQVRGFLSIDQKLPVTRAGAENITVPQFRSMFTAAYEQSGDHAAVKQQRHQAFLEFYHSVPKALLEKLEVFYQDDCRLFGYNCSINSRFDFSKKPKPIFHLDDVMACH